MAARTPKRRVNSCCAGANTVRTRRISAAKPAVLEAVAKKAVTGVGHIYFGVMLALATLYAAAYAVCFLWAAWLAFRRRPLN